MRYIYQPQTFSLASRIIKNMGDSELLDFEGRLIDRTILNVGLLGREIIRLDLLEHVNKVIRREKKVRGI